MKKGVGQLKAGIMGLAVLCLSSSCSLLGGGKGDNVSATTGAVYATERSLLGYRPYDDQTLPNPPGMVFIQGGRTILGSFEQDLYGSRDNIERTVTVNSFFMDETEITNSNWKEYVFFQYNPQDLIVPRSTTILDPDDDDNLNVTNPPAPWIPDYKGPTHSNSNPQNYEDIVPDDDVWASDFSFNDVYAENYYSNPGFNDYPVVGVSWRQVSDYCKWRTDFVNLSLIFELDYEDLPQEFVEEFFVIDEVSGDYQLAIGGQPIGDVSSGQGQAIEIADFDEFQQEIVEYINIPDNRRTFIERGIYLPDFRLPNEAEWEYAAKATVGTVYLDENEEYGRIYPWDGRGVRNPYGKRRGEMLANFKRGRGDYAGIAGNINNDASVIPEPVGIREPNDFNLFNMAGNVSEWVFDTYRPLSFGDFDDLNPVRKDGTNDSEIDYGWQTITTRDSVDANQNLEYRSMVNDRARVYKGGSWKDVAYWMAPGTRRYLDLDRATNTIGFRCAMISIGTQQLDQSNGLFGKVFGGK
ncbi:MAG TPA: SUMF1/EgtB/PvdO family nonheme iron enzyme [Roseivirga sp.]